MKIRFVRVTKNQWGNMRGYAPSLIYSKELGCNEWDATMWVIEQLDNDARLQLHPNSYITAVDVQKARDRLKS